MASWVYRIHRLDDFEKGERYIDRLTEALDEASDTGWEVVTVQRSGRHELADLIILKRQRGV